MLRFAPSPTGDMHIDDLRVAILNYLIAQQKNKQFLVRIDDTDTTRNIEGKDTEIMMILEKFALKHDLVFHQSQHLNLHQTLALRLLKEKKAFICTCSDETLQEIEKTATTHHCEHFTQESYEALKASEKKFTIRIQKPKKNISYHDVLHGEITSTPDEVNSFIILTNDNKPSHNFATAAADMMSNIDFVIHHDTHLSNTSKQIHIQNLLGYENEIHYAHIPMISDSKKRGSLQWLLEQGFIPDAILNYLILVNYEDTPKEIFTLPEAIEWFDLNKLSKSPQKFDLEKLRFINREHLRMMEDKELSKLFGFADEQIGKLAKVYLQTCSTYNELEIKLRPIFTSKDFNGKWAEEMKIISDLIFQAPAFETLEELLNHITKESGLQGENLFKPLQYLLTGTGDGPELSEIYPYIKSYILEVAS